MWKKKDWNALQKLEDMNHLFRMEIIGTGWRLPHFKLSHLIGDWFTVTVAECHGSGWKLSKVTLVFGTESRERCRLWPFSLKAIRMASAFNSSIASSSDSSTASRHFSGWMFVFSMLSGSEAGSELMRSGTGIGSGGPMRTARSRVCRLRLRARFLNEHEGDSLELTTGFSGVDAGEFPSSCRGCRWLILRTDWHKSLIPRAETGDRDSDRSRVRDLAGECSVDEDER